MDLEILAAMTSDGILMTMTQPEEPAEIERSDAGAIQPLSVQQREARGFCTCPMKMDDGSAATPGREPCRVHPEGLGYSAEYNQSHGLIFFDDIRERYVTWEDAVEGMRQPRYPGATSIGLSLFTWMSLMRLLEARCFPTREPVVEMTEQSAERLIQWSGQQVPSDERGCLISFARGGMADVLCKMFCAVARDAHDRLAKGHDAP